MIDNSTHCTGDVWQNELASSRNSVGLMIQGSTNSQRVNGPEIMTTGTLRNRDSLDVPAKKNKLAEVIRYFCLGIEAAAGSAAMGLHGHKHHEQHKHHLRDGNGRPRPSNADAVQDDHGAVIS